MTWDPHWRMALMKVRQLEASSKHQRCGEFRKPGRRTCTMAARRRFTMRLPVTAAKLKSLRLRIRSLVKLNVPPFSHFFDRSRLTSERLSHKSSSNFRTKTHSGNDREFQRRPPAVDANLG